MDQQLSQTDSFCTSDEEIDLQFEEKLKLLKIQDLQQPIHLCSTNCNTFKTLTSIDYDHQLLIKKTPLYQLPILQALNLLKKRFNITQSKGIHKVQQEGQHQSELTQEEFEVIQKATLSLKENNYSINMISTLLRQPQKIIKHIIKCSQFNAKIDIQFKPSNIHLRWITQFIKNKKNPSELSSMKYIFQNFKKQFPQETDQLKIHQFRNFVKRELNLKYKKPLQLRSQIDKLQSNEEQKNYILTLLGLKQKYCNIIYIDETILNNKLKQRRYWYFASKQISSKTHKIKKNISILGAFGDLQFFRFQLQKGNNNSISFGIFLNRVLKSAKSYYKHGNFALVLDNSSIHQSKFIRERFLSKVTHLFLPRYSPQLNPIELIWYQLKQQIIKYQFLNDTNISEAIHQSFHEIFSHNTDKYIEHTLKVAYDILQKQ